MPEVRPERTGWRDEALSRRHREWGYGCPALDIDFLLIEYQYGIPKALVEYKNENAKPQFAKHPSYQALVCLGDRAKIPVFACRYASDFSWWRAVPLNGYARQYLSERTEMDELSWVALLYKMRGEKQVPNDVVEKIQEMKSAKEGGCYQRENSARPSVSERAVG